MISLLTTEVSPDDILAIVVSRSRLQALYRNWQDKNMLAGKELIDKELEEYARSLHQLPESVWPSGKHDPELQAAIESFQNEVGMLTDDTTALYGAPKEESSG